MMVSISSKSNMGHDEKIRLLKANVGLRDSFVEDAATEVDCATESI